MDLNKSISNSRPISPSPVTVTETPIAAPATVEEGNNSSKMKRCTIYGRDAQGRFLSKSQIQMMNSGGHMSMNLGGGDFTPHIFTVNKGEDIIKRIMSFTEHGSREISVLSAIGLVANVKIQSLGISRQVETYKDEYEIVSLSSSVAISESGVVKTKTGGWRLVIGGVGGCIVGGVLVGRLIAASQVLVVVASFWPMVTRLPEKTNTKSHAVVVPPNIQSTLASSSARQEEPDISGPTPFLTLGWYGWEPKTKK